MNRPKHNRWLLTLFLVCAIILSLPLPKANAQNFVNNRFNVVVVLDASGSMKNTDPNGLRYEATGTGQNTTKRSIAEQRPVRPAAIRTMSMATIGIPMQTVSATIAARMSR